MPIHRSGMTSPAGVQRRSRVMRGKGRMVMADVEDSVEDKEDADESGITDVHPMAGCKVGPSVKDLRKTLTAIKQVTTNK